VSHFYTCPKNSKTYFIFAALLVSACFSSGFSQAALVEAKTSWAVSRVASASQGSYCTMAQKYADGTILTFAKNTRGEYSLAIDYQDGFFKAGEKQSIQLRLGSAEATTYTVVPQSNKAVVIGVGKDESFMSQVITADALKIQIGKENFEYGLAQVKAGQKELKSCIDALQASPEKSADFQSSEKTGMASPEAVIKKNVAVVRTPVIEPSVEGLLAAAPLSSSEMGIVAGAPEMNNIADDVASKSNNSKMFELEINSLREQNAKLSRAMTEQRASFENKQAANDDAALNEMKQKFEASQADNARLARELDKSRMVQQESKQDDESNRLQKSMKTVTEENQILKTQLSETKALLDKAQTASNSIQQQNPESIAIKSENETLKNQIEIYKNSSFTPQKDNVALEKMEIENRDLKQQIVDLKFGQTKESLSDAKVSETDEAIKLRSELRQMAAQIEELKVKNSTLEKQAADFQKNMEGNQLKAAGGSWDLEQATRRYQESQRELVRLGALLQSKDTQCANEKKDIEYMLFDPAIASKAQIAMLNSLEEKIKEKDLKVQEGESKLSKEKDAQISSLKNDVVKAKLENLNKYKEQASAQEGAIQALKLDLADKSKKLLDFQSKIQQVNQFQTDMMNQSKSEVASLKSQISETQTKLLAEQAKSQLLEAKLQAEGAKQASLAALQLQIQQSNLQIEELKKKLIEKQAISQQVLNTAPQQQPVQRVALSPVELSREVTPNSSFMTKEQFSSLLESSGIVIKGDLQKIGVDDSQSYKAYSWKTDSLFGSVEMRKVMNESQFNTTITQYLERAKSRCSGEFAAIPSPVKDLSSSKNKAYEIACVGSSASGSASVLFHYSNNVAMTIAHEGRAEAMDLAIDARDKLSSGLN